MLNCHAKELEMKWLYLRLKRIVCVLFWSVIFKDKPDFSTFQVSYKGRLYRF